MTTDAPTPGAPLLAIDRVSIAFGRPGRDTEVVRSASLEVHRGETVGLIGESGSGKTVTSLAAMGLLGVVGGRMTGGSIRFDSRDVATFSPRDWRALRGRRVSMIFQQPMRSLNPSFTVGEQIAEVLRRHSGLSRARARQAAVEMLDRVHIPDARRRARDYPHQFSGGMCQRVMIAMAFACGPELVIADEPTTALDVTVQEHVLALMQELVQETGVALLYISHDLAVVSQVCRQVVVMYAGETVESGPIDDVFGLPGHPYTRALLESIPDPDHQGRLRAIPGAVPRPDAMPVGCRFAPRCRHVQPGRCDVGPIEAIALTPTRSTRCVRADELTPVAGSAP